MTPNPNLEVYNMIKAMKLRYGTSWPEMENDVTAFVRSLVEDSSCDHMSTESILVQVCDLVYQARKMD